MTKRRNLTGILATASSTNTPRKRNRNWEREHQSQKVVYRGVDPKLALKVKTIAAELSIPEGEVARVVIECALRAYEDGDLNLDPRPNPSRIRRTLFSVSDLQHSYDRPNNINQRKRPAVSWRVITTWRKFPPQLKNEIAALASEDGLNVPTGELVTELLCYGLKAYESGLLKLDEFESRELAQ